MKRARTIIEEKMVRVESPRYDFMCQGGGGTVPGHLYYDEPWISDEHAQMLLETAKKTHYKNNGPTSWVKEPELTIYWKKISVTEREVSGMTREEVINKIIDTVERCEGKAEDCENCAMCQFCLEYFCGQRE